MCFLGLRNNGTGSKHTAGLPRELHHTEAFADMAPTGLMEYKISGTVNAFSTFYSPLT